MIPFIVIIALLIALVLICNEFYSLEYQEEYSGKRKFLILMCWIVGSFLWSVLLMNSYNLISHILTVAITIVVGIYAYNKLYKCGSKKEESVKDIIDQNNLNYIGKKLKIDVIQMDIYKNPVGYIASAIGSDKHYFVHSDEELSIDDEVVIVDITNHGLIYVNKINKDNE